MSRKMNIVGLIPSRLESSRLPRKALLDICGLPMVIHTYKRSLISNLLTDVYVCTDSQEIADVCKQFNAKYIMTSDTHRNGTERIAEAARSFTDVDYFIDIQGDEPLINPKHIDKVAEYHQNNNFDIILPHIELQENGNEHIVKVVSSNNKVIYLSRSDCPHQFRGRVSLKKHLSIISFTPAALTNYSNLDVSPLEQVEGVELLRALENNISIGTFELKGNSFSVDVEDDYLRAVNEMKSDETFLENIR